jgi:plasmid stabilization system protein ParE
MIIRCTDDAVRDFTHICDYIEQHRSVAAARRVATNSMRYDVRAAQPSLSYVASEFGKYLSTLTTPRFMQFALRFVF